MSDPERLRLHRKTMMVEDTAFTLALRLARSGRTLLGLAIVLEVPLGTLRHWLAYPPRRQSSRIHQASSRLQTMGLL